MQIDIEGPGAFAVNVVGESRRQDALAAIVAKHGRSGRTLTLDALLVPEDSNSHDPNAVRVEIDGAQVGYLSRSDARLFRESLAAAGGSRAKVCCKARIVGGFETASGERAHFGVRLDLPKLAP